VLEAADTFGGYIAAHVYVVGGYQHALGSTLAADGKTIVQAVANISLLSPSSGPNQAIVRIGICRKF